MYLLITIRSHFTIASCSLDSIKGLIFAMSVNSATVCSQFHARGVAMPSQQTQPSSQIRVEKLTKITKDLLNCKIDT